MMERFEIGSTPSLLSGPESESVFLFGELRGTPSSVTLMRLPPAPRMRRYEVPVPTPFSLQARMPGVRANSIGAWFSLLSFQGRKVDQALFVSPLLDMRRFIEEQPTREEDYYSWVLEHPVTRWNAPTFILRPEVDSVVSEESTRDFIRQHSGTAIVPEGMGTMRH